MCDIIPEIYFEGVNLNHNMFDSSLSFFFRMIFYFKEKADGVLTGVQTSAKIYGVDETRAVEAAFIFEACIVNKLLDDRSDFLQSRLRLLSCDRPFEGSKLFLQGA
jgi:hypothetical protein